MISFKCGRKASDIICVTNADLVTGNKKEEIDTFAKAPPYFYLKTITKYYRYYINEQENPLILKHKENTRLGNTVTPEHIQLHSGFVFRTSTVTHYIML